MLWESHFLFHLWMENFQSFHWSKTSRNATTTWNLSCWVHVNHVEYKGLSYGFTETAEKRVSVILKTFECQSHYCYSLMEVLPDFLMFYPENPGPLSTARVTSICFTYGVPVRVVGPLNIMQPKYQNLHKLSTFLYLYYKWRYWYELCELKDLCTCKYLKGTELGLELLFSEGLQCKHL